MHCFSSVSSKNGSSTTPSHSFRFVAVRVESGKEQLKTKTGFSLFAVEIVEAVEAIETVETKRL
jgi:hypothetical protein